jgi:hypothetical protein
VSLLPVLLALLVLLVLLALLVLLVLMVLLLLLVLLVLLVLLLLLVLWVSASARVQEAAAASQQQADRLQLAHRWTRCAAWLQLPTAQHCACWQLERPWLL